MPTARPWRYGPAVDYQSTLVSKTLEARNCQVKPVAGVLEGIAAAAETHGARVVVAATTPASKDQVVRAARAAGYTACTHDGMTTVAIRSGRTWRHHSVLVVPDHFGTGGLADIVAYSTIRSGTHIVTDAEAPETATATLQNTPIMTIAGTRPLATLVHTVYAVGEVVQPNFREPPRVAAPALVPNPAPPRPPVQPTPPVKPTPTPPVKLTPTPPVKLTPTPPVQPTPPAPPPAQQKIKQEGPIEIPIDYTIGDDGRSQIEYALAFMYHTKQHVTAPKKDNAEITTAMNTLHEQVGAIARDNKKAIAFVDSLLGHTTDALANFAQATASDIVNSPNNDQYLRSFFNVAMRCLNYNITNGALVGPKGFNAKQLDSYIDVINEVSYNLNKSMLQNVKGFTHEIPTITKPTKTINHGLAWHRTLYTSDNETNRKKIWDQLTATARYITTTFKVKLEFTPVNLAANDTVSVDKLAEYSNALFNAIGTEMKGFDQNGPLLLTMNDEYYLYTITNTKAMFQISSDSKVGSYVWFVKSNERAYPITYQTDSKKYQVKLHTTLYEATNLMGDPDSNGKNVYTHKRKDGGKGTRTIETENRIHKLGEPKSILVNIAK